jgi:hypothetical protein
LRTAEASQFHVADAAALLGQDPVALLYIATALRGAQQSFDPLDGLVDQPWRQPRLP